MASGDTVDGIIEIEDTSRRQTDGKLGQSDDENDEEEKEKGTMRGKAPSPLDMAGAANQAGGGPKTPPGITRHRSERERKLGHRRVGVGGEITYKKIQTSQIMGSIQLGIQHAVGGLASKPERDLLMQDFMTVETTNFDTEGSNHTPAHHYSDFKFKTYAPIAFRYFRDLFGIQPDDFLISMCSAPLRELSNPGASGSIFYLTADDEFIIKTVQHKEGEFLQKLLPGYYMNLNQNPRTLLPKFFGLYCYQCNSKNVRLVAMNNLLPSFIKLHHKYDLKGSTYKRKASKLERLKNSPTYKDLDFMDHHPEGIFLEADTYTALIKTIQRDCRVLESFKIMDYSLLVGIHNLDQAAREKAEKRTQERHGGDRGEGSSGEGGSGAIMSAAEIGDDRASTGGGQAGALNRSRSINRQRLVAHSTAMESIQAESEPIDEEEDVPPGGIPARNAKGERLLMFLGIIDILQSYRLKKKLEHTWKSMIHDGDTVSVHRPGFYAQRFQDFMAKTVFKKIPSPLKHSPSKRRSISKGGGGRLGSLPGAGLQDADTVAPSSTEEEGGLMASPHHAVATATSGSKPGPTSSSVVSANAGSVAASTLGPSSSSSTPPPPFEDAIKGDFLDASSPKHRIVTAAISDSPSSKSAYTAKSISSSESTRTASMFREERPESASVSDVRMESHSGPHSILSSVIEPASCAMAPSPSSSLAGGGSAPPEAKWSSLSVESSSSGFGASVRTVTWTPPASSVEGSTPTWTEGTPSFTESSSSGDLGVGILTISGFVKEAKTIYHIEAGKEHSPRDGFRKMTRCVDRNMAVKISCPTTPLRSLSVSRNSDGGGARSVDSVDEFGSEGEHEMTHL